MQQPSTNGFPDAPAFIKEIGRGPKGSRDLSRADAERLFAAMLAREVSDLQLGALLVALRVKGESFDELDGFLAAAEASYPHLEVPAAGMPVVIPSYNGARRLPNLVPLLALALARSGIPVLVHGVASDPGRVTTCEVFAALGIAPARDTAEAGAQLAARRLAFIDIDTLAPALGRLIGLRRELGVRSSGHTLVKMLNPFRGPALRLVSVTHPEYLVRMRDYFIRQPEASVLLLRGAEGEAVAHPRRALELMHIACGAETRHETDAGAGFDADSLPAIDAAATAEWIGAVLAGELPLPPTIAFQVAACRTALAQANAA
jgi:anthranilate phosphoribosyltransferase